MKPSRIAGAFALVLLAGAARAQVVPEYDSFGPLGSESIVAEDQAGGGSPLIDTAEQAQEKAFIEEYNRERDLEAVWGPLP